MPFDTDEDHAVGRAVRLALKTLGEEREVGAHGRQHRPAGDRIGVAHAGAVPLVDLAGFLQPLQDRPHARIGVVDDRRALHV